MSQLRQILAYSELINSIWIDDFDIDRVAGILRATVFADCLHDSATNVTKLAVYFIVRVDPMPRQCIYLKINGKYDRRTGFRTSPTIRLGGAFLTTSPHTHPGRSDYSNHCLRFQAYPKTVSIL